ncbi:MAG: hypothetical protein IPQ09_04345 [Myxococcales bacterium]|nr:hypothetical protein [Myxococcales bacterium]
MRAHTRALKVVALALLAACGSSEPRPDLFGDTPPGSGTSSPEAGGGGGGGSFGTPSEVGLVVEPSNAVLFIDTATTPPTPATQAFKVIRKSKEGDKDVTAGAVFSLEKPELGSFNGTTFTSVATLPPGPPGITTAVVAKADGGSAGAQITIVPIRRSSDQRDFFFIVPFNEAPNPTTDVLKFKTNIQSVDVAFVTDTTGSMSSEINGIRSALQGTLLAQLQAAIPSVGMSIISHRDETDGGELVRVLQTITPTLTLAQAAAGRLSATGGGDEPEGQVPAMFHVLTGRAVTSVAAHTPRRARRAA